MLVVVIDGQGGGMGRSIVERLRAELPDVELVAVGTNATATANMLKGGQAQGATGENAVLYNCARADIVIGPIGVFFANAMLGEVTPRMAEALATCAAEKIAIPVSRCHINIMGLKDHALSAHIAEAVETIKQLNNRS
ncbi:MAG: DUF3842 family protein [Christensenella sp.]|uniref:DUF3842 family protein n=1 Tax=Christensenella sp. TaxID=1935934 RepID=UPI002B1FCB18|nr:DUF3842 family protein [Christensenella sp.]MEA5001932.1 DUF3842 family protein [Christensenella sp.]